MTGRSTAMRTREAVREALRNVRAGVGWPVLTTIGLIMTLALAVLIPQLVLSSDRARAEKYQAAGANIVVLTAESAIDGPACDVLTQLPQVRAAGAVRAAGNIHLALLPSTRVTSYESTPGFADVIRAPRGMGVSMEKSLSGVLGVSSGAQVASDAGTMTVAGEFTYPRDGRRAGFESSIVSTVPQDDGLFTECWLDVWPQTSAIPAVARLAVSASVRDPQVTVSALNPTLGERFHPDSIVGSAHWSFPFAGAFAAAVIGVMATRARRVELASNRHAGVLAADQLAQLLYERLVVFAMAIAITMAASIWVISIMPADSTSYAVWLAGRGACAVLIGVMAGTSVGVVTIRERDLFRFFRER